jgi:hypothetical protein
MSILEGLPPANDDGARPMCSCGEMMMLTRIERGPPDVYLRTFECAKCHSELFAIPLPKAT